MTPTLTLSLLSLLLSVSAQLFLGDGPVDVPAASCQTFEEMKDVRQMQLLWTVSLTTLCFAIFLVQLLYALAAAPLCSDAVNAQFRTLMCNAPWLSMLWWPPVISKPS